MPFFLLVMNANEVIRGCDTGEATGQCRVSGQRAVPRSTALFFLCSSTLGSTIRRSSFVWEKKVAGGVSEPKGLFVNHNPVLRPLGLLFSSFPPSLPLSTPSSFPPSVSPFTHLVFLPSFLLVFLFLFSS